MFSTHSSRAAFGVSQLFGVNVPTFADGLRGVGWLRAASREVRIIWHRRWRSPAALAFLA